MLNPSLIPSQHEPYRSRLALLAQEAAKMATIPGSPASLLAEEGLLAPLINRVGDRNAWWSANRSWSRSYGRFFPGKEPYATLIFMAPSSVGAGQAICVAHFYDQEPTKRDKNAEVIHDRDAGWLSLTPFPADTQLPSIATVLAGAAQPTVVRYRPGKRCTIHFDGKDGQPGQFAKIFPDDRGRRFHAEANALWQASLRGELEVAVPRPLRWDTTTHALWQAQLAGEPVHQELFGRNGTQLATRMGCAAASLAHSRLQPQTTFRREDQWQETLKKGKELCRRIPSLTGAINHLIRELSRLHSAVPRRPLHPIHGAPHAHQWLYDGERLGLVDFDGFTLGDPELDIATFLSEMDYEQPSEVATVALNSAFLAGYEAIAGPVDRRLLQAYCAHKRLAKALKYAYAIHPEGDLRAEQAVGRALICAMSDLEAIDATGETHEPTQEVIFR